MLTVHFIREHFWPFHSVFKSRNFRVFRVFGIFSRKFLSGKKLNKKFTKVNFAKNGIFPNIIATKIEHSQKTAKVSSVNFLQKVKVAKLKSAKFRDFSVSRKFLPLKYFEFGKFVPKIAKRKNFCQILRVFFFLTITTRLRIF